MSSDRELYIKENINRIAEEAFPDNDGLQWVIHGFEHLNLFSSVEIEPRPDEVGYFRFKLVISFADPKKPVHSIACYCLEQGSWSLLFSSPGYKASSSLPISVQKISRGQLPVLPFLFILLGATFLVMTFFLWKDGIISSEGFANRKIMTVTRKDNPFEFWLYVSVMSFIGACFFIGGLKQVTGKLFKD